MTWLCIGFIFYAPLMRRTSQIQKTADTLYNYYFDYCLIITTITEIFSGLGCRINFFFPIFTFYNQVIIFNINLTCTNDRLAVRWNNSLNNIKIEMAKTEKKPTPSVKLGVPVGGGHVLHMPYSENACYLQQVKYISRTLYTYIIHISGREKQCMP